jgi:hypothetical protein
MVQCKVAFQVAGLEPCMSLYKSDTFRFYSGYLDGFGSGDRNPDFPKLNLDEKMLQLLGSSYKS